MFGHHHIAALAAGLAFALSHGMTQHHYSVATGEQAMLTAAASYWQREPSCGQPTLTRVDSVPDLPTLDPTGWAYVLPDGPQTCQIFLVNQYWTYPDETVQFGERCRLVAHEYAHLLDIWDSPAPGTMMSGVVDPSLPDQYCDGAARLLLGS